jgi:hypothetical protein
MKHWKYKLQQVALSGGSMAAWVFGIDVFLKPAHTVNGAWDLLGIYGAVAIAAAVYVFFEKRYSGKL